MNNKIERDYVIQGCHMWHDKDRKKEKSELTGQFYWWTWLLGLKIKVNLTSRWDKSGNKGRCSYNFFKNFLRNGIVFWLFFGTLIKESNPLNKCEVIWLEDLIGRLQNPGWLHLLTILLYWPTNQFYFFTI